MGILYSLIAVILLILLPLVGVEGLGWNSLFGIVVPYMALTIFVAGFIYRVLKWGSSPVPFHIPTVSGQQKSLSWIHASNIDSPYTTKGVIARLALEVLFFRSLFWNERVELRRAYQLFYKRNLYLWLGGLVFHWCLFVILFRHLRFFTEPVPWCVQLLENIDSFFRIEIIYPQFQFGLPAVYLSGFVLLAAVVYLAIRRIVIPSVRYISLASDFFPLLLIFGIAFTGIMMRYVTKIDINAAKQLTIGLVTFHPTVPEGIGAIFYIHLFFVSVLLAYFPFSKLMHLAGVFLSPTRNMLASTRAYRHVNPWNYPVKVHTYEEYEEEFREKMVEAGLPVDKPLEASAEAAEKE